MRDNNYFTEFDRTAVYKITVQGELTSDCSYIIEEMDLTYQKLDDSTIITVLTGLMTDQAALNGVLNAIIELQKPILSVVKVNACQEEE